MKLIDFRDFDPFKKLLKKMGAELIDFRQSSPLSASELVMLETKGIEIHGTDLEKIQRNEDGTLSYKGKRAILYIRDWADYGRGEKNGPKFHIAYCATYKNMLTQKREERYVVIFREDGLFPVNRIRDNIPHKEELRLEVCINCLKKINWKGYREANKEQQEKIKEEFTPKDFFERYPRDLINPNKHLSEELAPKNVYPDNWREISRKQKERTNYTCEKCGIRSSELHTHHKNGLKNDNREENLEVLCTKCHEKEHPHMRESNR